MAADHKSNEYHIILHINVWNSAALFSLPFNFIEKKNRSEHIPFAWQHMVYIDTLNQSKLRIMAKIHFNWKTIQGEYWMTKQLKMHTKHVELSRFDRIQFKILYTLSHTLLQSCTSTKGTRSILSHIIPFWLHANREKQGVASARLTFSLYYSEVFDVYCDCEPLGDFLSLCGRGGDWKLNTFFALVVHAVK